MVKDLFTNPRFNERVRQEAVKSKDLDADIELMWETVRDTDGHSVSTARAINAAGRVFNTVELRGLTGAEVKALLGSPIHSSDSVYRGAEFWSIEQRGMVFRFDNGNYGWQINVYCEGDSKPVTKVEKLWIH